MLLRRIPWLAWAALLAAAIIGALQVWRGGKTRVAVVGSGAVAHIRSQDAPPWAYYEVNTTADAEEGQAAAQIVQTLRVWPDVIVFGLPGTTAGREQLARLDALAAQAENATAVPVVLSPTTMDDALRRDFGRMCRRGSLRVCVDAAAHATSADRLREAVSRAVVAALKRHEALRDATYGAAARESSQ